MPKRAKKNPEPTAIDLCRDINQRLDNIEDLMAWTIRAEQRFRKGQRVKFSAAAIRKGVARTRHGKYPRGRIVEQPEGFIIKVQLDGYKHPSEFHHTFFEAI